MLTPIAITAFAALTTFAPVADVETTFTAPSHELAMIQCLSTPDDDYENCVDAVNNTDWAPMSTVFVARQLTNPSILSYVTEKFPDSQFDQDILVCELSFPTFYSPDSDMYLTDPNAFALEACIDDTISNHGMTEDL